MEISAKYLVGCDGARSTARHIMGAKLSRDGAVMRTQSTYIEAPEFLGMIRSPAWLDVSLNPRCSGYLFVIDGQSRWFVHNWRRRRPHRTYTTFASPRFQGAAHLIFALRDGRSLYDVLGPEFTLLRFDPAVETDGIVAAFAQSAVPLVVLDVDADDNVSPYAHKLVISLVRINA